MRSQVAQIADGKVPSIPRLMADLHRAVRESPEESLERVRSRLARLVDCARTRSPFYRERYAGLPREIRDVRCLPPVTKRELSANFDAWATDRAVRGETVEPFLADPGRIGRLYLDRYVAFSTSGTTGAPAALLQDRGAMAVYQALLLARRVPSLASAGALPAFLRNRARTATVIATGGHFASAVVDALVRSVHPRLYGFNRTFSLMEPLSALVEALNAFRPAVLGSYATALAVLAGEQEAGRLRIAPALVLSGAERLSTPLRERISAAFRCPVRDTYAASEFMGIAFDCRHGRLHANADWVILEPVDASGGPVPPGEPSRTTLLTNLANRLQPLIRYDLGDSVTMIPGPCPCGSSLPCVRPEGRRDEILYVEPEEGAVPRPLIPLVLATAIEETPGILRYQVIRTGPRILRMRVEEAPGRDRAAVCADARRRLEEYLSSQGLGRVSVEPDDELPQASPEGGKPRQFLAG